MSNGRSLLLKLLLVLCFIVGAIFKVSLLGSILYHIALVTLVSFSFMWLCTAIVLQLVPRSLFQKLFHSLRDIMGGGIRVSWLDVVTDIFIPVILCTINEIEMAIIYVCGYTVSKLTILFYTLTTPRNRV